MELLGPVTRLIERSCKHTDQITKSITDHETTVGCDSIVEEGGDVVDEFDSDDEETCSPIIGIK
jgi:hypothetical protein